MKKLLKMLAWIVGIFLLLIVVAVIGLKLFFPVEKTRQVAIEKGSALLGRDIEVESLDISVWGGLGLKLEKVKIGNPSGFDGPGFLSADNIDLKMQLLPLLSGDIKVSRLIIEHPTIYMQRTPAGENNYSFTIADTSAQSAAADKIPAEGQTTAIAVSFDEFEIVGGHLTFSDDSADLQIEITNLDMTTSLEMPGENSYASSGTIETESVKVSGAQSYPAVALALDYRIGYDLAEKVVSVEKAEIDVNDVRLELSGEVTDPLGDIGIKGNLKSDHLAITDLFSLLTPEQLQAVGDIEAEGDLAVDVDLEYVSGEPEPTVHYSGTAVLTDLSLTHKEIEGEFKLSRCLVDFKPDNLRMNIENGSFDDQPFKGHLLLEDFADPVVGGELAGSFNLAFLQPFLPAENEHHLAGSTSFDLKFSGPINDPGSLLFSGSLQVSDGSYQSRLLPEPVESFSLDAYFDNRLLKIEDLQGRFPSGNLQFKGRIVDLASYLLTDSATVREISPEVEGSLKGTVDLAMVAPYLPQEGNPTLGGQSSLDLTVTGRLDDLTSLRPRGTVSVSGASYADSLLPEPVERLDAEMVLGPDTITVSSMSVQFVSSDVSFIGQLIKPFPYFLPIMDLDRSEIEQPLFLFSLSSHRFDADKMFPEAVPGSGTEQSASIPDSVSLIILPNIDGRGTVSVDTLIYGGGGAH